MKPVLERSINSLKMASAGATSPRPEWMAAMLLRIIGCRPDIANAGTAASSASSSRPAADRAQTCIQCAVKFLSSSSIARFAVCTDSATRPISIWHCDSIAMTHALSGSSAPRSRDVLDHFLMPLRARRLETRDRDRPLRQRTHMIADRRPAHGRIGVALQRCSTRTPPR